MGIIGVVKSVRRVEGQSQFQVLFDGDETETTILYETLLEFCVMKRNEPSDTVLCLRHAAQRHLDGVLVVRSVPSCRHLPGTLTLTSSVLPL